jgi:hypothetical protein
LAIWNVDDTELEGPAPLPRLDGDELPMCAATIAAGRLIYRSESISEAIN